MKCYLVIKKNEVMILATTWMNTENITLSESRHTQKKTHVVCDSTQMKCPEQASSYTQKKSVSGCQGRRKQDWD